MNIDKGLNNIIYKFAPAFGIIDVFEIRSSVSLIVNHPDP